MTDHIVSALAPGVRVVAAITTELSEEARRRHDCWPVAAAALGRTLTAALLLAETLKGGGESLTVRISGDGPLGNLVADSYKKHFVRGYVHNPHVDLPPVGGKLAVGAAVGAGMIHVTRFNQERDVFTGTVELVSGEIAEDVTRYLLDSEQINSTVGLGVLVEPDGHVSGAAGFLVQAMPDATEETLQAVEKNLMLVSSPSQLAGEGVSASGMARLLLTGLSATLYSAEPIRFGCTCNRERVASMLAGLGPDELKSMIESDQTEIRCNFCNEAYKFKKSELSDIIKETNNDHEHLNHQ